MWARFDAAPAFDVPHPPVEAGLFAQAYPPQRVQPPEVLGNAPRFRNARNVQWVVVHRSCPGDLSRYRKERATTCKMLKRRALSVFLGISQAFAVTGR